MIFDCNLLRTRLKATAVQPSLVVVAVLTCLRVSAALIAPFCSRYGRIRPGIDLDANNRSYFQGLVGK